MPGGGATIRKAGPDDAPAIDGMVAALAGHLGTPAKKISQPYDVASALSASPPLLRGLIAEDEGCPVGLCLWFPCFSSWRGCAGLFVLDLYVAPSSRRSGLARRLLAAAAGEATGFGARFIRLGVDRTNLPAIAFYDRLGFDTVETEKVVDLFGPPFDALADAAGRRHAQQQPDRSDRS